MSHNIGNYRVPVFTEPRLISGSNVMQTPFGNIQTPQMVSSGPPPPLPPSPLSLQQSSYGYSPMSYGSTYSSQYYPNGGFGGGGYGGSFSGFGTGFGSYGGYGSYNRFGGSFSNPMDPESRFIQLAEEGSRPAFQSIEGLVGAIGNIAAMLDSTFFALTSSFRAMLGVAANFSRLRGVFAQFWSTFALFRGITWLYRKLLYLMKLSNVDPSSMAFKEAFAAAAATHNGVPGQFDPSIKRQSPWPVVAFLGFIFTVPYLIMKLLGSLTNSAVEESRNPRTWVRPITSQAIYDFQARNPQEISLRSGQTVLVAPKEIQNTNKLMSSGWALASVDGQQSGLIPITYVQPQNLIKRESPATAKGIIPPENNEQIPIPIPPQTSNLNSIDEHMPVIPEVDEKI